MEKRIVDFELKMDDFNERIKKIHVFLPIDYEEQSEKRYPVLYMHDGQNLMEPSSYSGYSWNITPTLDLLQKEGVIDGIIVVGIDADETRRIPEYSHYIEPQEGKRLEKHFRLVNVVPEGKHYSDFVVNKLKTHIDQCYRTIPDQNGIAGSSCGGNVSLYLALDYPKVFSVVGAFSSAYWILKKDLFPKLKAFSVPANMKIYHDMGTKENGWSSFLYVRDERAVQRILASKGMDDSHLKMVIDHNATHNELFWQVRFKGFIEWAYKKSM